jgi:predicted DNA-binding transcriptional regulator AlpA
MPRPGPDVMGMNEIARLFKVSRQRMWVIRAESPYFPKPRRLSMGDVFDASEVRAFKHGREHPRRRRIGLVVQAYNRGLNIADAAREAGVPQSTARKWLIDMGKVAPPASSASSAGRGVSSAA